jgi:hypothetical protein
MKQCKHLENLRLFLCDLGFHESHHAIVCMQNNDPPQMRVEVSKPYSFKEGTYSIVQAMLAVTAVRFWAPILLRRQA